MNRNFEEIPMGFHTVITVSHDHIDQTKRDPDFGKTLGEAVVTRRNPNIPSFNVDFRGTNLGPQFHSNDTLFVRIEDGVLVRLSIDEQNLLEDALRRFRKREQKNRARNAHNG